MAEWVIKIGDSPTPGRYEDGDIVDVFNRRRIRLCHADMICHPRVDGKKVGGQLGNSYPLLEQYYQRQSQYKWERVSRTEIKRTNLWVGGEIVYGSTPVEDPDRPGRMIHCHVEQHFAFRNKSQKLPIFNRENFEVEYGGKSKRDAATAELIWDDIEAATPLWRVDHDLWPLSDTELRHFLVLPIVEFDDAVVEDLLAPLTRAVLVTEDNPDGMEVVKKRKNKISWKVLFPMDIPPITLPGHVQDRRRSVDVRGRSAGPLDRMNIVEVKAL